MLEGTYPALITPFTEDDRVDIEGLRILVDSMVDGGVSGIVPCGTTGESATLTHEEHEQVVDAVIDVSEVPVIPGTGSNSTKEAVCLTRYAEDAGASAALLITPYYNKPNKSGLVKHFKAIADAVHIPLVLYNVPGRTGINMEAETVAELAKVDNIMGIKEASGNLAQISRIIKLTADEDFTVISGDDGLTLPIIALGGRGVISVCANVAPRQTCEMVNAALGGNMGLARKLHHKLSPLFDALFLETNPIPVKKAMELIGMPSGHLRPPLSELGSDNEVKLIEALTSMGIL